MLAVLKPRIRPLFRPCITVPKTETGRPKSFDAASRLPFSISDLIALELTILPLCRLAVIMCILKPISPAIFFKRNAPPILSFPKENFSPTTRLFNPIFFTRIPPMKELPDFFAKALLNFNTTQILIPSEANNPNL